MLQKQIRLRSRQDRNAIDITKVAQSEVTKRDKKIVHVHWWVKWGGCNGHSSHRSQRLPTNCDWLNWRPYIKESLLQALDKLALDNVKNVTPILKKFGIFRAHYTQRVKTMTRHNGWRKWCPHFNHGMRPKSRWGKKRMAVYPNEIGENCTNNGRVIVD